MTSVDVSASVHSLPMKFSAMLFHPERRATRTLAIRRIAGDNKALWEVGKTLDWRHWTHNGHRMN